jgi:hypothetical protein
VLLVLLAFAGAIAAAPPIEPAGIRVERSPGAEACADANALARWANQRIGAPAFDPDAPEQSPLWIEIRFSRSMDVFRAEIQTRGRIEGVRSIEDASESCASLVDAVTLALALLVDRSAQAAPPLAPGPADPVSAPDPNPSDAEPGSQVGEAKPVPVRARAPAPRAEPSAPWSIELMGGGVYGVVSPIAPGFIAGVAWRPSAWSVELDVEATLPSETTVAPGALSVAFLGARASGCRRLLGSADLASIDLCASATLARLSASASGFSQNRSASRPWIAGGLAAVARGPISGSLGWRVLAGADVPVAKEGFSIDNVSAEVYSPPRVTALGLLGLSWTIE